MLQVWEDAGAWSLSFPLTSRGGSSSSWRRHTGVRMLVLPLPMPHLSVDKQRT